MDKDKFNILAFTDEEVNDELIDALLKAGSQEYIQNSTLEIPDSELSDIEFSEELDRKMLQYFDTLDKREKQEKIKYLFSKTKSIALRAAAALLVLVVLAVGFVATSEATQIRLLNMYVEHSDIDTNVIFNNEPEETYWEVPGAQITESLEYIFRYIPDGYEHIYEENHVDNKMVHYEGINGGFLTIEQTTGDSILVDSEGGTKFNIEIDELTCFVTEKEGRTIVTFKANEYGYLIISTLPLDEIIKIVENMDY